MRQALHRCAPDLWPSMWLYRCARVRVCVSAGSAYEHVSLRPWPCVCACVFLLCLFVCLDSCLSVCLSICSSVCILVCLSGAILLMTQTDGRLLGGIPFHLSPEQLPAPSFWLAFLLLLLLLLLFLLLFLLTITLTQVILFLFPSSNSYILLSQPDFTFSFSGRLSELIGYNGVVYFLFYSIFVRFVMLSTKSHCILFRNWRFCVKCTT